LTPVACGGGFSYNEICPIYAGEIPCYRLLARIISLPVIRRLANFGDNHIAAPLLFAIHLRRQRRTARDVRS